jgi:hypothetical protein
VGFHDVGQVLADDVATGRTEDVADEKNIHSVSLSRVCAKSFDAKFGKEGAKFREVRLRLCR